MEFISALKQIISNNNISLSDDNADVLILSNYLKACENKTDYLQYYEFKNIVNSNIKFSTSLYNAYNKSIKDKDKEFNKLIDCIEFLADELEKNNIYCFSYSYFIYSFLNYFLEFKNNSFIALNIEKVEWINPEEYDYSFAKGINNLDLTFGIGRNVETLKSFSISKGRLIKYKGKASYIIIPAGVTSIASDAFKNNTSIKIVYLPASMMKIGEGAFSGCENLETIFLSKNIDCLPDDTFNNCQRLYSIVSNKLTKIGNRCFKNCTSLRKLNTSSLQMVGDEAFYCCTNLSNFSFIDNLNYIGVNAFYKTHINNVKLTNCKSLGARAFESCADLQNISIYNDIKNMGVTPFFDCLNVEKVEINCKFSHFVFQLFSYDLDNFNLQHNLLKEISYNYLHERECENYKHIKIVNIHLDDEVPSFAFCGCTDLETVYLDKEINRIGSSAFFDCQSLKEMDIKYSGTTLEDSAFYNCHSMKSFDFLRKVISFGYKSLARTDLSKFNFDRPFKRIGAFAFANCEFKDDINLYLKHCQLNPGAFKGVKKIKSLKVSGLTNLYKNDISLLFEQTLDLFNERVEIETLFVYGKIYENSFNSYKNIGCINYIDDTNVIPKGAFSSCLANKINVSSKIDVVEESAFQDCSSLEELNLSFDRLKVMDNAFDNTNVLPNDFDMSKVTYIASSAFKDNNLEEINVLDDVEFIGENAFANSNNLKKLSIPYIGPTQIYKDKTSVHLSYLLGTEDNKIKELTIKSSVIENSQFDNCPDLETLNLPAIRDISNFDFSKLPNLSILNLGKDLDKISSFALRNNANRVKVNIDEECEKFKFFDNSLLSKDRKTLYYLDNYDNIDTFINGVETIMKDSILKTDINLTLTEKVKSIEEHGIDCSNLESIEIDSIVNLSKYAFYNCDNIKEITLSNVNANEIFEVNTNALEINAMYINNINVKSLQGLFSKQVNLTIKELYINNCQMDNSFFEGVTSIENMRINNLPQDKSKLFDCASITNLKLDSIDVPLSSLYRDSSNYGALRTVSINNAINSKELLKNLNLDSVDINKISDLKLSTFENSKVKNLSIGTVDNIEEGALSNLDLDNFEIYNGGRYKTIDGILSEDNNILCCFNKDIETFIIPENVEKVYSGALQNLSKLKSLVIESSKVLFSKNSIVNCNNLTNLVTKSFKNDRLLDIFSDEECFITNIEFYGNVIKRKFFSDMKNLVSFSAKNIQYIGQIAFANDKNLKDINLSNAKIIKDMAFYNCHKLKEVIINPNLEFIGYDVFNGCDKLNSLSYPITKNQIANSYKLSDITDNANVCIQVYGLEIPKEYFKDAKNKVSVKGARNIYDSAFENCLDLTIDMSKVEKIGNRSFKNSILTEVDLPNVNSVGEEAFANCSNLSSIKIGDKLNHLGQNFALHSPIKTININSRCKKFFTINSAVYANKEKEKHLIYYAVNNDIDEITIKGLNEIVIDSSAFFESNIKRIQLDGIKSIETGAFDKCKKLVSIHMSNNITSEGIFNDCYSVKEFAIDKVEAGSSHRILDLFSGNKPSILDVSISKSISESNFNGLTSVKNIKLPSNIKNIPDVYFYDLKSLESVNLPSSITKVGNAAFKNCTSLKSLAFPNVTEFGYEALSGCCGLKEVILPFIGNDINHPEKLNEFLNGSVNLNKVKVLGGEIVSSCFENNTSINSLEVNSKVINARAFKNMSNLNEISINNATKIGEEAFMNCKSLQFKDDLFTSSSITDIGESAFKGCRSFKNIILDDKVKNIGLSAFSDCGKVDSIVIPYIGTSKNNFVKFDSLFNNTTSSSVKVLGGEIVPSCFENNTSIKSLEVNSKVIESRSFKNMSNLKEISINDATTIGEEAFMNCKSLQFSDSFFVSSNISNILQSAFKGCKSFKNIILDDKVKNIGLSAFSDCGKVESIVVPYIGTSKNNFVKFDLLFNNTTSPSVKVLGGDIADSCFSHNNEIVNLDIRNVNTVGEKACESMTNLSNLDISHVKNINKEAFAHTNNLKLINSNLSAVYIGEKAFYVSRLQNENIVLNSLKSLGKEAFNSCKMSKIVMPLVTKIEDYTFFNCSNLTLVKAKLEKIGKWAFGDCTKLNSISLDNVYEYGEYALNGVALETIKFNSEVKNIPTGLISESKVKKIILNDGLESIANRAFQETNLVDKVFIPSTVKKVGEMIFYKANPVTVEVTFDKSGTLPGWDKNWYKGCKIHGFLSRKIDVIYNARGK